MQREGSRQGARRQRCRILKIALEMRKPWRMEMRKGLEQVLRMEVKKRAGERLKMGIQKAVRMVPKMRIRKAMRMVPKMEICKPVRIAAPKMGKPRKMEIQKGILLVLPGRMGRPKNQRSKRLY